MIGHQKNYVQAPSSLRFLDGIAVKAAIKSAFLSADDMDTSNVKISVPANYVAVEGHVATAAHRKRVMEIAQIAAGNATVKDALFCR